LDAPDGCGVYPQCVKCYEQVNQWIEKHRMTAFTEIVYPLISKR
jgi:bacterioferritin-associated ferredoxin